jgi:hypothetical protein
MKRRAFISFLGGAAAWPLAARAQQPGKLPTIGFLGTATASLWGPWVAAFVQRLRDLGWIEGSFSASSTLASAARGPRSFLEADGRWYVGLLRCRSPFLMLWTAPPPAQECHGCGGC